MIGVPRNAEQAEVCASLLELRNGSRPSPSARYLVWLCDNRPEWVVAFDNWLGTSCFVVQANTHTRFIPRTLIKATFEYAFGPLKRTLLFSAVDENNDIALRINKFVGFTEVTRFPSIMPDGGALILMSLRRDQCRWLETLNG